MDALIASVLPLRDFMGSRPGEKSTASLARTVRHLSHSNLLIPSVGTPAFSTGTILKISERVMLSNWGKRSWGVHFLRDLVKIGHVV